MDSKPVVTYSGDEKLFESLKNLLTDGLPQESVEWRRSHVRNPKPVYVTANFSRFSEENLVKGDKTSLLGEAFFHTYWTQCNDVDIYKQSVKDDITEWLSKLKTKKVYDWLIVVVDYVDTKKVNKTKLLPRTTVIDKIKNDFPSQGSQRCISLLDPFRSDSRAAESWQLLLQRVRKLILQAYSRQLSQFEEHMRTQRERRNEPGWNFQDFFFLQEELAFVLEMLGLYDEALVQYDELDALFTQFVINSNAGDMPDWLTKYSHCCDLWSGICLLRDKTSALREVLRKGAACLLDLRNYLFSRQCALLLMLCRPWEVAQRSLPFLHNCISELRIMEISMPEGSVACWVFLSCLEVLQTCEKFSDTSQIKAYSLYTAGLWAYAREKLHELGLLCGLMPDQESTSEHLHLVVSLLSGMGPDPYPETGTQSPHEKLREALSSKESFLKHYMELSELTMGTFKHNRRIRTARLIGRDLAQLYMKLKQPQKAAVFLVDLLKTYREENWESLMVETQKDLFECYRQMDDNVKYLKTCIRLAATLSLSIEERDNYFQEVTKNSPKLGADVLHLTVEKVFLIEGADIISSDMPIVSSSDLKISLSMFSCLPEEIICRYVKVMLKHEASPSADKLKLRSPQVFISPKRGTVAAHSPLSPMLSGGLGIPSREELPPRVLSQPQLVVHSYYQGERILTYGLICKNNHQLVRRRDSQNFHKEKEISDEEVVVTCKAASTKLTPGTNSIIIPMKASEPGLYTFTRMWMEWGNVHFTLNHLPTPFSFIVVEEPPSITLKCEKNELLAGIDQELVLSVFSGSKNISAGTNVSVKAPDGLKVKVAGLEGEWSDSVDVILPDIKPFQTHSAVLSAISDFAPQKNANTIEHRVLMQLSLSPTLYHAYLHFLPPFLLTHKLHTCGTRKYIHVVAHGMTPKSFSFKNSVMKILDRNDIVLKELNSSVELIVSAEQTASFLWEIMHEEAEDDMRLPTKFLFETSYELKNEEEPSVSHPYRYELRLGQYETLYAVRARVEPVKGSEFCRAGIMCYMHISINQITRSTHTSLMYEVIADQEMWAVCGMTAGVVNIDNSGKHSVVLEVMPLIGGFLPLPSVCLSKYIPAESHKPGIRDANPLKDGATYSVARLEPFDPGQVYNWSRAMQVHVLPGASAATNENPS